MHTYILVVVEADDRDEAEALARCVVSGCPEDCGEPPFGQRIHMEWDYIDFADWRDPDRGIDVKLPATVKQLGLDQALKLILIAREKGDEDSPAFWNMVDDTDDMSEELVRKMVEEPERIWLVLLDVHS